MACVKYFQRERKETKTKQLMPKTMNGSCKRKKRNPLKRISKETFLLLTICQQKICYGHYDNPLLRKASIFIQTYLVQTLPMQKKHAIGNGVGLDAFRVSYM